MPSIILLIVAVVVFYLLWILIDYVAGLLPKSEQPPLPVAAVLHIILILAAVWWLATRFGVF